MNQMIEQSIAVVGMAGRFPGAEDISAFWNNICHGKESITSFTNEDLLNANSPKSQIQSPHYVNARGVLDGIEFFDNDFFEISPLEAQLTDPQQRLFLECAFEALENAGYCTDLYSGSIGVFGGAGRSTYFLHHLLPDRHLMETMGNYLIRIGNEPDFLTTRVSYKLNLTGPSLSIQTACSTSLSAICVACNHLLTYQCNMALAGGASISLPQKTGYLHQEGMIFSPDGHCRPFDAAAQGTVPSNGVGIVLLKRLEDALADRDHIYAIIRGYGMSNDGAEKISYSAPSVKGQVSAIESAIAMSEIDPATIRYAETHGTGTSLGDPIEIEALSRAFRNHTQDQKFCAIGSIKSNIGHCMEAAGIMGFINAVLALHEKKIPPLLHFNSINPQIKLENSPFYVNTELKEWPSGPAPRRACVSSFGLGGTNTHLILEEAPQYLATAESNEPNLLVLSAKTPLALDIISRNLGDYLKNHPSVSMADVSYSLQIGRKTFEYRRSIVCRNREEAIAFLLKLDARISSPLTPREKHLTEIGIQWASGAIIDWQFLWSHFEKDKLPSRIPLPTYPFEKKRCWVEPLVTSRDAPSEPLSTQASNSIPYIEKTLIKIWEQFLGIEKIDSHDNFFVLGGDSLLAIQVISQIELELSISLKLQTLYQFPSISQLTNAISKQTTDAACLMPLKTGSGNPLFLIHGIDGTNFSFKLLLEAMEFQGPIFGIEASNLINPGHSIEELATSYIEKIREIQSKGPYLICGFSFGGIVAYEMARQLELIGDTPKFLGIVDAMNPQHNLVPLNDDRELLVFLSELLEGKEMPTLILQNLSNRDLLEKLVDCIGLNILPKMEQQTICEQIQRHLKSLKHYLPASYNGNVAFFEAKERFFRMKNVPLATTWKPLIKGRMDVYKIEGTHLNILKPPNYINFAKLLDLSIAKVFKK